MAGIGSWYDKRIAKLRQLPRPYLILFILVKFIAGVAVGLILAIWLPIWTWWIFLAMALLLAFPLYSRILGK